MKNPEAGQFLAKVYLAGTQIPADSPCLKPDAAKACSKWLEANQPKTTMQKVSAEELPKWRSWLGLPIPAAAQEA